MPAQTSNALSVDDLKKMYDNGEGAIWVSFGRDQILPAILDVYDGVLVAVWSADGIKNALSEKDYGTYWLAYPEKPVKKDSTCRATGKPCCYCQKGPCESRKEGA